MSSWLNRQPVRNKTLVQPILPVNPALIPLKKDVKESNVRNKILLEEKIASKELKTISQERALQASAKKPVKPEILVRKQIIPQKKQTAAVASSVQEQPKKEISKFTLKLKQTDYTIGVGLINVNNEREFLPNNCSLFICENESEMAKNKCLEQLKNCDYIFIVTNNLPNYENWWVSFIEQALSSGEHYSNKQNIYFLTKMCLEQCGGFNIDYEKIGEGALEYSQRAYRKKLVSDHNSNGFIEMHDSFILHALYIKRTYMITFYDSQKHVKKDLDEWVSIQSSNQNACIVFHDGLEEENTEFVIYVRQIASLWKTIRLFSIENRYYLEGIVVVDYKKCVNLPRLENIQQPQTYANVMYDCPEYFYIPTKEIVSISTIIEYMMDNMIVGGFDLESYNCKFIEKNHS